MGAAVVFSGAIRCCAGIIAVFTVIAAVSGSADDSSHGPLSLDCDVCHDSEGRAPRKDSPFNHTRTGFPLEGVHRSLTCTQCHKEFRFRGTPRECAKCHEDIHNGEFGADCARCHRPATFVLMEDFTGFHDTTRFPLLGAHRRVPCSDCHAVSGKERWTGLNTACAACHFDDYRKAQNPPHLSSGFGTDCSRCHSAASWTTAFFDHQATRFPLTGAHRRTACTQCHTGSVYAGLPSSCADCHHSDFTGASSPNHTAAGFPITCADCHTTTTWIPSSFDHSQSGFALTGAHQTASCVSCHPAGVYRGTSTECRACHLDVWTSSTDPPHSLLNLSQSCGDCHTTSGWRPANYTHPSSFPLTGAHALVSCVQCHTTAAGRTPPADCFSCHTANYTAAGDHTLSQFPRDCTECHTTTAWKPSTFTHTQFAIYSGEHRGQWHSCTDCHTVPGNFSSYTCTKCHKDNPGD
jgi:hypothetical protein